MNKKTNLVWMDLEMTGLEPEHDQILEIATVITDQTLTVLAQGPNLVIHQADSVLEAMGEWCTKHHQQSGLTDRVRSSTISLQQASQQTLAFVEAWVDPGVSPLCGNSIWQDRRFLRRYMPQLDAFFHYRNIDVSTIKELVARWQPQMLQKIHKQTSHRALDDIMESIEELQWYRANVFTI